MDEVSQHHTPADAGASTAPTRGGATAARTPGGKKAAKRRPSRGRGRSLKAVLAAKARGSGPSIYARRLQMLMRWGVSRGDEPLTLAEIDRLVAWTVGQTHAFIGRTQNPHVDTLFAYAALFGVNPAWFITGFGPRPHVRSIRAAIARARAARALEEAKAAFVAESVSRTAARLRGMSAEEFEEARRAANVGGR